jgi:AAA family ATP:ADP antiporter
MILNLINNTGEQVLAMIVQERAKTIADATARREYLMGFYANFHTWTGALTAAMQLFAVARLVRRAGMRVALTLLPLLALVSYGALAVLPVLTLARMLKIAENSANYSLQNTLQQILFLPTSREVKYKAKEATDTFIVRFGDLVSWAVVAVALHLGIGPTGLALFNAAAALLWLTVVLQVAAKHRRAVRRFQERARAGMVLVERPAA